MRIISGKYKSRKVNAALPAAAGENCIQLNHSDFRPTSDRARESLFNILNNIIDFEGLKCLDLYAGTGAVGFELLSRGAAHIDFVEIAAKQVKMIEKTADELGCAENITLYKEDVYSFIAKKQDEEYDLIFADPPYKSTDYNEWLGMLLKIKFTVFILEFGGHNKVELEKDGYDLISRKTGITNFKILVSKN